MDVEEKNHQEEKQEKIKVEEAILLIRRCCDSQQKKRTCRIVDFAVPADHWVKLKESEKKEEYLHLARELKKLRNMNETVIPIVVGALGTVIKG